MHNMSFGKRIIIELNYSSALIVFKILTEELFLLKLISRVKTT